MENDESSESGDLDCSESADLDEISQPKMNTGQQNTTAQEKKLFYWRKKPLQTE